MRARISIFTIFVFFIATSFVAIAQAQQDSPPRSPSIVAMSSGQPDNYNANGAPGGSVEGTVVSSSPDTLVVRTGSDQFQLFTYDNPAFRTKGVVPGARVRVTAGDADENGTRTATNVAVLNPPAGGGANSNGTDGEAPPAPVPVKVHEVENDIRRESRRWDLGFRAGAAFDPELFMFGIQSRMGPIFHPRVFFRPNAEFAFGEVTDLIALNLEGIYQFSSKDRMNNWRPYAGAGPALTFIHQGFSSGRQISFGNFDYETGFNVLFGMRKARTFVELKTSLWSGPAPKLRLIFGYTF